MTTGPGAEWGVLVVAAMAIPGAKIRVRPSRLLQGPEEESLLPTAQSHAEPLPKLKAAQFGPGNKSMRGDHHFGAKTEHAQKQHPKLKRYKSGVPSFRKLSEALGRLKQVQALGLPLSSGSEHVHGSKSCPAGDAATFRVSSNVSGETVRFGVHAMEKMY